MNLGEQIFTHRKKQRLSQEQLGALVGVTRQTISNWELNETLPDAKQLLALSDALAVSIDTLLDHDIHSSLEQKVNDVDTKVVKNTKLLRMNFILILMIIIMVLAFISAN